MAERNVCDWSEAEEPDLQLGKEGWDLIKKHRLWLGQHSEILLPDTEINLAGGFQPCTVWPVRQAAVLGSGAGLSSEQIGRALLIVSRSGVRKSLCSCRGCASFIRKTTISRRRMGDAWVSLNSESMCRLHGEMFACLLLCGRKLPCAEVWNLDSSTYVWKVIGTAELGSSSHQWA